MEDALAKMQQETIEFRAEVRNMFHTIGIQQEETNIKLDCHIKKMEPILEGLVITKLAVKVVKYGSAFLVGVGTLYLLAKQVIRGY